MNEILQAIGTVGFPIVMCIILVWYLNKQNDIHREETAKMTEALNNNTIALNRIETKIGVENHGNNS